MSVHVAADIHAQATWNLMYTSDTHLQRRTVLKLCRNVDLSCSRKPLHTLIRHAQVAYIQHLYKSEGCTPQQTNAALSLFPDRSMVREKVMSYEMTSEATTMKHLTVWMHEGVDSTLTQKHASRDTCISCLSTMHALPLLTTLLPLPTTSCDSHPEFPGSCRTAYLSHAN
jgi:hypothetical protein